MQVTVEEHQINGGLGEAVAHVAAKNTACPMEFIGVNDSFGESKTIGSFEKIWPRRA
nr:hypothetical protein [Candidatus Brachybacter algidus]